MNINLNENIKIIKDHNSEYIYTIHFPSYSQILIDSIIKTRILLGATATNNYHSLSFKALSVIPFPTFQKEYMSSGNTDKLSIPIATKMLQNLSQQLNYLIAYAYTTIIAYHPENIIVIDTDKFIYVSNNHLLDIDPKTEHSLITFPFTAEDFLITPELSQINEIPTSIHFKSTYFSLGCLILYVLTGDDNLFLRGKREEENNIIRLSQFMTEYLDTLPIKDTKLYSTLKRTLVEDVKNRSILFI